MQFHWSADYLLRALNSLGYLLMYCAVFLYEDQEGQVQNRIVQWWIKVDDARIVAHSRAAAFLQRVARVTVRGFDRVLGERLLSLRFAGVSLCFSIASGFLIVTFGSIRAHQSARGPFLLFVFFCAFALVPSLDFGRWVLRLWGLVLLMLLRPIGYLLFILYSVRGAMLAGRALAYLALAFGVSLVCDVCYVGLTRWMLRKISAKARVYEVVLLVAINLLLLSVVLVAPIWLGIRLFHYWQQGAIVIFLSFILNAIDILAGSAAFALGLTLLVHRLLWHLLEKPLYALQRYRVISNKKLLWGVGLALAFLPTHATFNFFKVLLAKLA